jgi:hypothetical protein
MARLSCENLVAATGMKHKRLMLAPTHRPALAALVLALSACAAAPAPVAPPRGTAPAPSDATADGARIATAIAPFRFARAADARAVLGARDAFVASLGPLDRALRLASTTPIDEATYLAFAAKQALDWTPVEEDRLRRAVLRVDARAKKRGVTIAPFAPPEIALVTTTGSEEFGLPYTRAAAIVLPAKAVAALSDEALADTVAHELFHVLSRRSATLRERAYRIIGFERRGDLAIPPEIEPLRLTNPDGYQNDFALALPRGSEVVPVVPFIFSKKPAYEPEAGNFVLDYADFTLLVVNPANGAMQVTRGKDGRLDTLGPGQTEYLHCVGRNTDEIIHPDEVMADNFVRVLARAEPSHPSEPTPALIDAFEALLRTGAAPEQARRCPF